MTSFKIWQAPFKALYSLSFYREVLKSSISAGLTYLAFLSLIAAILAGIAFNTRALPEIRDLIQWLKSSSPLLTVTPEGLQMETPSPYVLKHPRYGPLVIIDFSKASAGEKDFLEGNRVLLTKQRGFFYSQAGIRAFDYNPDKRKFRPFPITDEMFERLEKIVGLALLICVPIIAFFFFFIWKFMLALIYSGLAVLINRFRRQPLRYENLLNLSFFAMTTFVLIEFATLFIPQFEMKRSFFTGYAVTALYLSIALLKSEPRA